MDSWHTCTVDGKRLCDCSVIFSRRNCAKGFCAEQKKYSTVNNVAQPANTVQKQCIHQYTVLFSGLSVGAPSRLSNCAFRRQPCTHVRCTQTFGSPGLSLISDGPPTGGGLTSRHNCRLVICRIDQYLRQKCSRACSTEASSQFEFLISNERKIVLDMCVAIKACIHCSSLTHIARF